MKTIWRRYIVGVLALSVLMFTAGTGSVHAEGSSHFLWKIDNGGSPCYLLGSIHMMKKEHYPLSPVIENAFSQCDVLGLEINMTGAGAAAGALKLMKSGSYGSESSLKDNVSASTLQLLEKKVKELGMDAASFTKYKPWMAAMLIMQWEMGKLGFNPLYGIDMHFMNQAKEKKMEIVELENFDLQIKLFAGLSKEDSEMFLRSTLLDAEKLETQMNTVVNAWMKGDTKTIEGFFTSNVKEYPELEKMYKKMNDDRNVGMAEKVVTYLKTGKKYFIVVGAAHMVGKNGVVQMLKDKGYTVTQL